MYEAKQLELACLMLIKNKMDVVMVAPMFGRLSKEWPAVMLKIAIFTAGVPETSASAAFEAQQEAPRSELGKRKREE